MKPNSGKFKSMRMISGLVCIILILSIQPFPPQNPDHAISQLSIQENRKIHRSELGHSVTDAAWNIEALQDGIHNPKAYGGTIVIGMKGDFDSFNELNVSDSDALQVIENLLGVRRVPVAKEYVLAVGAAGPMDTE